MVKKKIIWIGPRESDINYTNNFFSGSITIFGSNNHKNISFQKRINHNEINHELDIFFNEQIEKAIHSDPNTLFYFYNPFYAFRFAKKIQERTVCLNSFDVLGLLNSKIDTRFLLKKIIKIPNSINEKGYKINFKYLYKIFSNTENFVIQEDISSGGNGTFILNRYNEEYVKKIIKHDKIYLISEMIHNALPINIHIIISETEISLSKCSIQIIENFNYKMLYKGADFFAFNQTSESVKKNIYKSSNKIGNILKSIGYRGIFGIDFIVDKNNEIYFVEINNRFQASTSLINISLRNKGIESLQEQNYYAFNKYSYKPRFSENINYSNYLYFKETEIGRYNYKYNLFKGLSNISIDDDGIDFNKKIYTMAYLFRVIFKKQIAQYSPNKDIWINENIRVGNYFYNNNLSKKEFKKIKFEILNQGAVIDNKININIKKAVFSSIDFNYKNKYYFNSPNNINFSNISPYRIVIDDNIYLTYYNKYLFDINVDIKQMPINAILYHATDRIRINLEPNCIYQKNKTSCKFCNIFNNKYKNYDINDIYEAILTFEKKISFRHYLIGGPSNLSKNNFNKILSLSKFLKKHTLKPISLMSVPINDVNKLHQLYENGISEISFNIEIFDDSIARKIMPGKSNFSRQYYFEALEKAVYIFKKNNVRSIVIVGLESDETLFAGIEKLCKIKVQPVLSIFRPIPRTKLENCVLPSSQYLNYIYEKISNICKKHHISLGPSCKSCQNNILIF
jgi:hypothetical protein